MERRKFLKMLGVGAAVVAAPKPRVRQSDPDPVNTADEEIDEATREWLDRHRSLSMAQWDGTFGLVASTSASFDSEWNSRIDRILVDTGWSEVEA